MDATNKLQRKDPVVTAWDELGPRWMRGWLWEEAVRADIRLSIHPSLPLAWIKFR